MLTSTRRSALTRYAGTVGGLTALWAVLALVRDGTTFHLAPALVAGSLPVLAMLDSAYRNRPSRVVLAAAGTALAVAVTLALAVAGAMDGPSLLPTGGAVLESVVFALAGGAAGLIVALAVR